MEAHADLYATDCTTFPTATAEIIDLNSPTPAWAYTGSMVTGGRKLHYRYIARGRQGPGDRRKQRNVRVRIARPNTPAYPCELWDPATGAWTTMASLTRTRTYHSTALLLPDGRVLSAGGVVAGGTSAEVYSPSLSVPRPPSNYHVSAYERCIRAVIFRGHT